MSILKTGAFCVAACASALAFGAPASAQTKVYVKVVVGPHTSIADVQPYHDGGAYYVAEPRKQSRWR